MESLGYSLYLSQNDTFVELGEQIMSQTFFKSKILYFIRDLFLVGAFPEKSRL